MPTLPAWHPSLRFRPRFSCSVPETPSPYVTSLKPLIYIFVFLTLFSMRVEDHKESKRMSRVKHLKTTNYNTSGDYTEENVSSCDSGGRVRSAVPGQRMCFLQGLVRADVTLVPSIEDVESSAQRRPKSRAGHGLRCQVPWRWMQEGAGMKWRELSPFSCGSRSQGQDHTV